jgi:hypothetical protein
MTELEDIKLQALLQKMKLDSPKPNFSVRVMNRIFNEENALEKIKSEKILGKGFWIIIILFIGLMFAVLALSNTGIAPESQIQGLLPEIGSGVSNGYKSLLGKMSLVPLGIGGILMAFSALLFIDRIVSNNSKRFA